MWEVCPGHALDRRIMDWALFTFRLMDGNMFRDTAYRVDDMAESWKIDVEKILCERSPESEVYGRAAKAGDWNAADKIFMDVLKIRDRVAYNRTLYLEGLSRVFNQALAEKLSMARFVYRWAHTVELRSYQNGTFESKREAGGERRGYKAFSLWENIHAISRPVAIVPIDDIIRDAIRAVTYTALPRSVDPEDERIGYWKHLSYAHETECRIPDGIRVPRGTRISVRLDKLNSAQDPKEVRAVLGSLKNVGETELI